jgi:hypothetical protein
MAKLNVAYLQRKSSWFGFRILWLTCVELTRQDGV